VADLSGAIETAAGRPQSATIDGTSASTHSIADLIKADQYLAMKIAARKRLRGMAVTRLVTPGTVDDCGRAGIGCGFGTAGGLY
jgi:hypothetical protein